MKKTIQLLLLLGLAAISTGCATPYMVDRGRDAADIFTAAAGAGIGAKARVGPVGLGLLGNADWIGLRGGQLIAYSDEGERYELCPTISPCPTATGSCIGMSAGDVFQSSPDGTAFARGKWYKAHSPIMPIAVFTGPPITHPFYTQIEVVLGLGATIRLGFNPGELLDFFLGWFTIDIYNDDLEWKKRKSNK